MKRASVVGFSLVMVTWGISVADGRDGLNPTETLRQWAATLATSDVSQMVAFYEDGQEVTAWESTGNTRQGTAQIREMYEEAFEEVVFEKVQLGSLEVRQWNDIASAKCRFVAETVRRTDNSKWVLEIRSSFVLKRDGEAWKIAFEHFSPIAGVPRASRRN